MVKVVPFAGGFQRYSVKIRKGKAVLVKRRRKKKKKSARHKKLTDARRKTTRRRQPSRKWQPYTVPSMAVAALGPDRVLLVELTYDGHDMLHFSKLMYGDQFTKAVQKMLTDTHTLLYRWIKAKQLQYVPEDTGALRRNIMRSIRKNMNEIKYDFRLEMFIGTTLPYASWVNEMPTYPKGGTRKEHKETYPSGKGPHVRHPPYVGGYTHGSAGNRLSDDKAMHHFYDFMLTNSRKMGKRFVNEQISKLYRNYGKGLGLSYSQMRRLFTVRTV